MSFVKLGLSVAAERDWSSGISGCEGIGSRGEGSRAPSMHSDSALGPFSFASQPTIQIAWGSGEEGKISRGSDGISGIGDRAVGLSSGSGV